MGKLKYPRVVYLGNVEQETNKFPGMQKLKFPHVVSLGDIEVETK